MVELPVSDDVGALAKSLPTVGAHIGLLSCVDSPVLSER